MTPTINQLLGPLLLLFVQVYSHSTLFLDVTLKIETTDDFEDNITVPYAIPVLTTSSNFDLQPVLLQEGILRKLSEKIYFDTTVIRYNEELAKSNRVYLGLYLFSVPRHIQRYLIIDVTDTILKEVPVETTMSSNGVIVKMQVLKKDEKMFLHRPNSDKDDSKLLSTILNPNIEQEKERCNCEAKKCSCCRHVRIAKLHINDKVCANFTFSRTSHSNEEAHLRTEISVGEEKLYKEHKRISHIKPFCFPVPQQDYGRLCVKMHMEEHKDHIVACPTVQPRLYHLIVDYKTPLGCLRIPL